jgi:hypothetical protein
MSENDGVITWSSATADDKVNESASEREGRRNKNETRHVPMLQYCVLR